ncbi:MAG: hypothetical protein ACJ8R9_11225, partial [Steroidobacteraceae bacterium]
MLRLKSSHTSVELLIADPEQPNHPLWSLRARWAGNCPFGYYDRFMLFFPVYEVESVFDPDGEASVREKDRFATAKWTTRSFVHHVASCALTEGAIRTLISGGKLEEFFDSPALRWKYAELTRQLNAYILRAR